MNSVRVGAAHPSEWSVTVGEMFGLIAVVACIGIPLGGYLLVELIANERSASSETAKRKMPR